MIRNYFRIAWRNLLRNKVFSLVNILGLTAGLTCCILLLLYLQHELSYDRFHTKGDRIARVIMEYKIGDSGNKGNFTSTKVFPEFKRKFPEVESGVRMVSTERVVKRDNSTWLESDVLFADSTFFSVFDFNLLQGAAEDALKSPFKVVLSKSLAQKFFGTDNPVGKTLLMGSKQDPFLVTAVAEDCPSNSQIKYSMVASISSFGPLQEETYSNANYTTYLLLKSSSSFSPLQKKISAYMKKESQGSGWEVDFELEPFTRIHLYSPYDAFTPNSNINYIYIISGVAILILVIASFTYVNLSTARSTERAKEVGIRKVAGAWRSQLFLQFISESVVLSAIALFLSILFAALLLPYFNELAGTGLPVGALFSPSMLAGVIIAAIIISLLAGSYPALVLSRFQPVTVLKGAFKNTGSGTFLRKGLIVFQFVISVFLIIATFVIGSQLHFIRHKKLGYDRDNIILLEMDQRLMEKQELIKAELLAIPSVKGTSLVYDHPASIRGGYNMSGTDLSKSMAVTANPVDENFITVTGLQLIAGADLTRQDILDAGKEDYTQNYHRFILNESAARALAWTPEEAIGKRMYLDESRPGEVKGVVKDFHFASLHTPIKPLVLFPGGWANRLLVKLEGGNIKGSIDAIADKWKQLAPHRPFSFRFLDEEYQRMYASEMRAGKIFNLFATLAVLLACLGLFGSATYSVRQRVKEVGVRKVLGASVFQVSALLSSGFLKLVIIAIFLASPLAWMAMNKWLQQFSYRVEIGWWIYIGAGLVAVLLAIVTVSFQTIRAAISNPVKSLRTE